MTLPSSNLLHLGSFAYAVSRLGARKVLAWTDHGSDEAYDVRIQHGCTSGKLTCIVVNPEIMQHYKPPKRLGASSEVNSNDPKLSEMKAEDVEQEMGSTRNIMLSSRCSTLFNSTCNYEQDDVQ